MWTILVSGMTYETAVHHARTQSLLEFNSPLSYRLTTTRMQLPVHGTIRRTVMFDVCLSLYQS